MRLKFLVSSEAGAGIKRFLWSLCNISQYITMNHNACGNQFELILKGNVSCLELREEQLQLVIVSGMDNFVRIQGSCSRNRPDTRPGPCVPTARSVMCRYG